jgi:hypothetical protein
VSVIDRPGKTIQTFNLEPFEHVQTLTAPLVDKEGGLIADPNGGYFLMVSKENFAIVKSNGDVLKNPIEVVQDVVAVSYNATKHLFILQDSLKSLTFIQLDASGNISSTWRAGNRITVTENEESVEKTILSGGLLADATLALALNTNEILVVDAAASMTAQDWVINSTIAVPDADGMNWVAPIHSLDGYVFVTDSTNAFSIDLTNQKVMDTKAIELEASKWHDFAPHLVMKASTSTTDRQLVYIGEDGKFTTTTVPSVSFEVFDSYLNTNDGTITVSGDNDYSSGTNYSDENRFEYLARRIVRVRLKDSLPLDITEIKHKVRIAITDKHILALYNSSLGKAQRYTLGIANEDKTLKAYNWTYRKDQRK